MGLGVRENSLGVFGGKSPKHVLQPPRRWHNGIEGFTCCMRPSGVSAGLVVREATTARRRRLAGVSYDATWTVPVGSYDTAVLHDGEEVTVAMETTEHTEGD